MKKRAIILLSVSALFLFQLWIIFTIVAIQWIINNEQINDFNWTEWLVGVLNVGLTGDQTQPDGKVQDQFPYLPRKLFHSRAASLKNVHCLVFDLVGGRSEKCLSELSILNL